VSRGCPRVTAFTRSFPIGLFAEQGQTSVAYGVTGILAFTDGAVYGRERGERLRGRHGGEIQCLTGMNVVMEGGRQVGRAAEGWGRYGGGPP
jgi:hypothetical protein